MYISYNKNTKKVIGEPSEKRPVYITENVAICEVEKEIIPQSYDYLLVDNVRQATRVIKEAYTEEVVEYNEETGEEIAKLVEHEQETETYYTCDLIAKFYEYTAEQLEAQKRAKYKALSKKYIRQIYDVDAEFEILRKKDIEPDKYNKYFADIESCLAKAHKEVYGW